MRRRWTHTVGVSGNMDIACGAHALLIPLATRQRVRDEFLAPIATRGLLSHNLLSAAVHHACVALEDLGCTHGMMQRPEAFDERLKSGGGETRHYGTLV